MAGCLGWSAIPSLARRPDGLGRAFLDRRFSGLARLYGNTGAQRIAAAHVAVVGIGGVGSWAAEALARSAVGRLTLIDFDHISESNINRQIHALTSTLGQAKVLAMRDRIHLFYPDCDVHCVEAFVAPGLWPTLLPSGVDAVIDACDQTQAKTLMAAWARQTQSLFITVGAAGGKRHAHLVQVDDLAHATHDPLLAQLRQRLRQDHAAPRDGQTMNLTSVFSRERVTTPACDLPTDGSLNCHGYGSVMAVTATFGLCATAWVLDRLASEQNPPK